MAGGSRPGTLIFNFNLRSVTRRIALEVDMSSYDLYASIAFSPFGFRPFESRGGTSLRDCRDSRSAIFAIWVYSHVNVVTSS